MLHCHSSGAAKLERFFESRIIHSPSVNAPVRQRLKFMGAKKHQPAVRKAKPQSTMILALKAQLLASRENNAQGDAIGQQFSLLPVLPWLTVRGYLAKVKKSKLGMFCPKGTKAFCPPPCHQHFLVLARTQWLLLMLCSLSSLPL